MADRKNIFLIGRRRMKGDEDQLTEMLAFLWQERPETLEHWLRSIGREVDPVAPDVVTQFSLPNGKRPDIAILTPSSTTLVESKLGAGFHETQIPAYLDYLESIDGDRALVLLTERPEKVPPEFQAQARASRITLLASRWHDMADCIAEPGEESLPGDFVQLLIREGLVKPQPFSRDDWATWNGGFNVLLRLDAFLTELGPLVHDMKPNARWRPANGLTKRWIYRVWRAEDVELGLGFGAAAQDDAPHTDPVIFAFVGNKNATYEDAMRAVGVQKGTQYRWTENAQLKANVGLHWSGWPALARWSPDVLTADTFEDQLHQAANFMLETAAYFRSRGFLPETLKLRPLPARA